MASYSRYILGRGCDPVRAAFAKKNWEPILNAQIDCATSDDELITYLTSGIPYSVFFLAPGMCSLIKCGRVDGQRIKQLVLQYQPNIQVVNIENVSQSMQLLSQALGDDNNGGSKAMSANSSAWPFVD